MSRLEDRAQYQLSLDGHIVTPSFLQSTAHHQGKRFSQRYKMNVVIENPNERVYGRLRDMFNGRTRFKIQMRAGLTDNGFGPWSAFTTGQIQTMRSRLDVAQMGAVDMDIIADDDLRLGLIYPERIGRPGELLVSYQVREIRTTLRRDVESMGVCEATAESIEIYENGSIYLAYMNPPEVFVKLFSNTRRTRGDHSSGINIMPFSIVETTPVRTWNTVLEEFSIEEGVHGLRLQVHLRNASPNSRRRPDQPLPNENTRRRNGYGPAPVRPVGLLANDYSEVHNRRPLLMMEPVVVQLNPDRKKPEPKPKPKPVVEETGPARTFRLEDDD